MFSLVIRLKYLTRGKNLPKQNINTYKLFHLKNPVKRLYFIVLLYSYGTDIGLHSVK